MNRTLPSILAGWRLPLFLCGLSCIAFSAPLLAQTPLFLDEAPPDEMVDCFGDLPQGPSLRAVLLAPDNSLDTVPIFPIDELSTPDAPCMGGFVTRVWTARDATGTVEQSQTITFGAAGPDDGPTINLDVLPVANDTVDCRSVDELGDPDSYARWLGDRRVAMAVAATPGCAPIVSITDNAPTELNGFDCNDRLEVTFVVVDLCGRMTATDFSYNTVDTVGPVIVGAVNETIRLSCEDFIPPPPDVTVEDCDTIPTLMINIESTQLMDGSCRQYDYDITRQYLAADACGNMTTVTTTIEVRDTEPPNFLRPPTQNLDCTQDPFDLDVTGRPSEFTDNCTPIEDLDVSFTDEIISDAVCSNSLNVERTWRVADACGNSRVRLQIIRVRDTEAPNFTAPADTLMVDCANFASTSVTSLPTNLEDNCDPTVNLSFEDEIFPGNCAGNFAVERTWRIFDDCGNDRFTTQYIEVVDTMMPVFTINPTDLVTSCNGGFGATSQEQRYNEWLADFAGARFMDGCTPLDSLTVDVYESGTTNFPFFPAINCAEADGVVRRISVDIVVTDQCGNSNTITTQYRQIDELPINLLDCPTSTVQATDPGFCFANVALPPPVFQDQCASSLPFQLMLRDSAEFTSAATNPGQLGIIPVNPITLNLVVDVELPVNAFTNGTLKITLENADAEGEEEYFFIYGEDGTLLGITGNGAFQCETVVTIDTLAPNLFNQYASDGVVTIRLEPNIPADRPTTFAINNLCEGGGRAYAELVQPAIRQTEVNYEIGIGDGEFTRVNPVDTFFTNLGLGIHQVTYRATDCGGNVDECIFTVTVEDREPPVVTCPDDIEVILAPDSCQFTIAVPLPVAVTDNCEPYTLLTEESPRQPADRLFPFFFDPNLNSFQAGNITAILTDVPFGLVDTVDLDVHLRGQFNNRGTWLDVVLPDGSIIGSTERGIATCDDEGIMRLRVAAATVLAGLAADGTFSVQLRPRPVTVPPGREGDGLIPCDEDALEGEGSSDGISYGYITATYRTLYPSYFTTGATTTPLTTTNANNPLPQISFNQGVTDFSYVVTDQGGNSDTCTIAVTVRDTTPPVAVCQATTVFVDPSGLSPVTVFPVSVDGGSFDNCGIMELRLEPARFSCSQYDEVIPVTLTVEDPSGNTDSCSTIVSIAPLQPEPSASSNVCGGDTLLLFANPPTEAAPGQTIYTYRWFDPLGNLISTQENPIIPGVDQSNDGAYRVEIRGLSGCASEGVVFVAIGEIPEEPFIEGPERVCTGDEVTLFTSSTYAGSVSYEWYRGQPGASEFLGTSVVNSFSAPLADGATSGQFFARAIVNGCASPPSNRLTVGTTQRPDAAVDSSEIEACAFSDVTLSAVVMPGLNYEWTGPNDFFATGRVVVIEDINVAGTYFLRTIRDGGCYSLPASVEISLLPADAPTFLTGTEVVCPQDTLSLSALDDTGLSYLFQGPNGQEIETTEPSVKFAPVTEDFVGEWRVRVLRNICYSGPSDPLFVSLSSAPEATASIIPDPICVGNDLILQGASDLAGSSYRWEGPNGFNEASIAPVIPDVTEESNGSYILTVTSSSGCSAKDTLEIDVQPGLRVDSIIVSSGECLIGGEPVSLSAVITPAPTPDDVYTYQWTGPEGTSSNFFFQIPSVSLASNGQYSLTVMNGTGCRSPEFEIPVEFDFAPSAPTMPFSPDGVYELCAGEDLVLQTNDFGEGVTYLWRLGDGTNIPTTTNSLTVRDIQGAFTGFFSVRVIRNNCTSMPSMGREITITAFPEINLTATTPACSGQAIEFQVADIAGATYAWTGPNNFSSSLPNPIIVSADNAVHAGEYSVVVNLNGCVSDTMRTDITILPTPRVPVAQPINPICIGDPDAVLELQVNPNTDTEGAQYAWFIQNGQTPVGEPTEDLVLNVTDFSIFAGGGLFEFAVRTIVDGCESALSTPVTVRLDDIGNSVADAGRDTVICAGIYLLEAGPINSGSGRWTLVQGTGDISIANPGSRLTAVQGLTEFGGPYEFAWTLSEGSCGNYTADTITLTVTDGEEAIAGENFLVCVGDETRLDATPTMMNGSGGRWTQGLAQEILGVVIEEPTNPNTILTGLQPDNVYSFTWTVTSNCGVKSDNVLVNVSDPTPFAGEDFTVCNAERSTSLAAESPTIGSMGRWLTDDGSLSFSDPESPTSMILGLKNGENELVWEVDEGFCGDQSRDTVIVFYAEPSQPRDDTYDVDFQGTVTFDPSENDINPPNAVISFTGLPPEGGILTDNNDGTFTYQVPPNYVGEIALDYEVLSDDCSVSMATVFIRIGKDVNCDAPNIFTPNGDNMNDFFVVPCLLDVNSFPESEVTIYNQWGDEVYRSSKPYRNDWDGTYQGSNLPVATYFYIINFGGSRKSESGDVRIER